MSKIEIFLTVCAIIAPIVAFVAIFPKGIKFKKKPKPEVKTAEEANETFNYIQEQPQEEIVEEKEGDFKDLEVPNFSSDDFKDYLNKRPKTHGPMRRFTEDDLIPPFEGFERKKEKEEKTITDQINDLTPELKAMLIAGVLDRKNFD